MENSENVVKQQPNISPLPKAIEEVFGKTELPDTLPDEQRLEPETISHRARKGLLDLTKELRKVAPTDNEVSCEVQNGITLQLYNKILHEEANGNCEDR